MLWHPRLHGPGLRSHFMARGNNGQAVFLGSADYASFFTALQTSRERYPFSLSAYVLMPNHFHLLLEGGTAPTGGLMQALLTSCARRFKRGAAAFLPPPACTVHRRR